MVIGKFLLNVTTKVFIFFHQPLRGLKDWILSYSIWQCKKIEGFLFHIDLLPKFLQEFSFGFSFLMFSSFNLWHFFFSTSIFLLVTIFLHFIPVFYKWFSLLRLMFLKSQISTTNSSGSSEAINWVWGEWWRWGNNVMLVHFAFHCVFHKLIIILPSHAF